MRAWTEDDLLFIRDVAARTRAATARKQAENALRASELQLRQVADALPVLVSFVDRTLAYRFANAAYRDWLGLAPAMVVGRTVREITGEQGYVARLGAFERAFAGESVRFDLDWPWPDGRRRIADISYIPHQDDSGAVDGFYAFVQGVTTLRDAAAVLAEPADTLTQEVAERTADRNRLGGVDTYLSHSTVAARVTTAREFLAVFSYRVATRRNCLSLLKQHSMRCRSA